MVGSRPFREEVIHRVLVDFDEALSVSLPFDFFLGGPPRKRKALRWREKTKRVERVGDRCTAVRKDVEIRHSADDEGFGRNCRIR
jgi:hypothetical protein